MRARIIALFNPSLNALGMEVMLRIALQLSYLGVFVEWTHADSAVVLMLIFVVRYSIQCWNYLVDLASPKSVVGLVRGEEAEAAADAEQQAEEDCEEKGEQDQDYQQKDVPTFCIPLVAALVSFFRHRNYPAVDYPDEQECEGNDGQYYVLGLPGLWSTADDYEI